MKPRVKGYSKSKKSGGLFTTILITLILCTLIIGPKSAIENKSYASDYSKHYETPVESDYESKTEPSVSPAGQLTSGYSLGNKESDGISESVANNYYYSQLSSNQQKMYRRLLKGLLNFDTRVDIEGLRVEETYGVLRALRLDNPAIFWTRDMLQYHCDGETVYVEITVPTNAKEEYKEINKITNSVISGMPSGLSEYDKVKYLHDWIIHNVSYSYGPRDQDVRSTLLDGAGVCNAYAFTFKLLCDKAGIPCATVIGYAKGELHAWNLVNINGVYSWVDSTWDDEPVNYNSDYVKPKLNHLYFCIADNELELTHQVDTDLGYNDGIEWWYPVCTSYIYDYYERNGMAFDNYNYYVVHNYISQELSKSNPCYVEMKFSSWMAYEDALYYLFEEDEIHQIMEDNGYYYNYEIYYWGHDDNNYLQIYIGVK